MAEYKFKERGTSSLDIRMLKSDRGRPVSDWRHVWTMEAGTAGGHPVLLIHAGLAFVVVVWASPKGNLHTD